jgi:hypothetical protein
MKTKYPSMFGVLAALLLVASFIIPTNLVSPSPVQADVCRWDTVYMPGEIAARADLFNASEINKIAVGSDGATILAVVTIPTGLGPSGVPILLNSPFMGIYWDNTAYVNLAGTATFAGVIYDVVIAPDNPAFWVVTAGTAAGPTQVWATENGGGIWTNTQYAGGVIGCIDVSVDYGGRRDIAAGVRIGDGTQIMAIWVVQTGGFGGWRLQTAVADATRPLPPGVTAADVFALKFSPTYPSDAALAVVFVADNVTAGNNGTLYNIALRDVAQGVNQINQWALVSNVEVAPTTSVNSALARELVDANLELPSDFSGQAASLRRAYISTDSGGANKDDGIFRIDDTTVYVLMDTTAATDTRRISSIAYYGTYASGKLLAGEYLGFGCTATVPTWFTDSPTTCPVPCWYPCLKCPTGAAGQLIGTCALNVRGVGNAQVVWFMNGQVALAATGSSVSLNGTNWWVGVLALPIDDDESALSISRNNGETWNQIAIIDTTITYFNDFATSADCNTLYLASASVNLTQPCKAFDSVWRSSLNEAVVAPLPPIPPIGSWYERVYTRPTALSCNATHSDLPLLRLPPGCDEPTGQIVGWAAQNTAAQAWSPDYGDYWANITARFNIQDFAFESTTVMYNLNGPGGLVQKLPYTGTAWSTTQPSVNTHVGPAHMITAMPEGIVMVGHTAGAAYPVTISSDGGANFGPILQALPALGIAGTNIHVAFDPDYKDNSIIYIADDSATGRVYRNNVAAPTRWTNLDMMAVTNGAYGCPVAPYTIGYFGLALPYTGTALYAASANVTTLAIPHSGVERTLDRLLGMPKPGIGWDFLDVGLANGVVFTREPYSLKLCGCCTIDTDTTIYALDARNYSVANTTGFLWAFTDCLAKVGPTLITEDKMLIGCDPVSGRAQEVNLCWEQLCVANGYDIEIAKDDAFTIKVLDWVGAGVCAFFFVPADVTTPCAFIPAGGVGAAYEGSAIAQLGNLECGHTYYWRVQVRSCATTQVIRSPWSDVRSFTVKAGLPVTTPYYGPQLLAPNNGCLGCPVSPVSFSWSPFKETTKYKFVLAKDAAMTQVVKEAEVATTAFEYDGTLDYSTNYFWRVMSLEPAPSDWSATFSFQTEAAPPAPVTPTAPVTPVWVWVVIAIGAILVIVTLVLIFKTRRV